MPNNIDEALIEAIGDAHESFSATTPLRADAFEEKVTKRKSPSSPSMSRNP